MHKATASELFGVAVEEVSKEQRAAAKTVNFATIYGQREFSLAQQLGIDTKQAKQFIADYFAKYAGVRQFIDRTIEEARREGRVKTLFGRVRPIPDILSKNFNLRSFAERTAVNTPLQGTAADLIKLAMISHRPRTARTKTALADAVAGARRTGIRGPRDEVEVLRELVKREMEQVHALRVPLVVEIGVGLNWRDMK